MFFGRTITLLVYSLLVTCVSASAMTKPETVPRRTVRQLDVASYVELARQWKKYIEENGESAEALVNLGRAYDYSGEIDAAAAAAKRAVEVDTDNTRALAFYAMLMASWGDGVTPDVEGSIILLERCREIAPDYGYGLTNLATSYMRLGDLRNADAVFETIFKERIFPGPLQDYAYNVLVGLPEGAAIITWGDNDTFVPLALQAGMGFRKDVAVLNLSLLNVDKYTEAMFKRYPTIKPEGKLERDGSGLFHKVVIKALVDEQNAPVYIVSAVNLDHVGDFSDLFLEGFNLRTSKKGLTAEDSAKLLLETYRLDSATDWNYAWSLTPSLGEMMTNYVAAMIKLSEYDDLSANTIRKLLKKALTISEFHEIDKLTVYINRSLNNL